MAHGYAGVKEQGIEPFAKAFADAGFVVLLHDHRNFGASGGTIRGDVDPWRQIADWRYAISYLESLPEVDARRIGLWGTSYAGGMRLCWAPLKDVCAPSCRRCRRLAALNRAKGVSHPRGSPRLNNSSTKTNAAAPAESRRAVSSLSATTHPSRRHTALRMRSTSTCSAFRPASGKTRSRFDRRARPECMRLRAVAHLREGDYGPRPHQLIDCCPCQKQKPGGDHGSNIGEEPSQDRTQRVAHAHPPTIVASRFTAGHAGFFILTGIPGWLPNWREYSRFSGLPARLT
jgi:dienelactone hydrolase